MVCDKEKAAFRRPSFFTPHKQTGLWALIAGGADLGARPPAAGSLHRAGCEDGRAGQRQDPRLGSHLPGCQILHLLLRQRIDLHPHSGEFEPGDFLVDHRRNRVDLLL